MNYTQSNMQMPNSDIAYPPLQSLNLVDDFLFDVTTEDLEACKIIIELALGITLKEIRWKEGQKVLHNLPGQRGIRMDFYAVDIEDRIFNVEMQKRKQGNIPKRTRFYQGLVDAPLLKTGESGFDNLNPLCIVVICDFDLYGYGKYRYTFTNRCHEVDGLELGDESSKIILNTKGSNEDEVESTLVNFLHYVSNSTANSLSQECDPRLRYLHNKISQIKASEQMEAAYMKMEERDRMIREEAEHLGIEKGRELGISEGRELGISEGQELGISKTIHTFILSARKNGISDTDLYDMLQMYFQLSSAETDKLLASIK